MRLSGSDATGSDYSQQRLQANGTTVDGARSTAQTSAAIVGQQSSGHNASSIDIFSPAIATPTVFTSFGARDGAGTSCDILNWSGGHNLSTAYDGFTLIMLTSGTTSGALRVYGYRNS
jgi:hypothetical protein